MQRYTVGDVMNGMPIWARTTVVVVFAYAIINFILCAHLLAGGGPDIVDGQHVLSSHGRVLAHITEGEYRLYKAYELRMFSGGWLLFYWLPGVYFLLRRERGSDPMVVRE